MVDQEMRYSLVDRTRLEKRRMKAKSDMLIKQDTWSDLDRLYDNKKSVMVTVEGHVQKHT